MTLKFTGRKSQLSDINNKQGAVFAVMGTAGMGSCSHGLKHIEKFLAKIILDRCHFIAL